MKLQDDDNELLRSAIDKLGEHFDSVQIFVTKHLGTESGGTHSKAVGVGNWYARYGQVVEWLIREKINIKREMKQDETSGDQ